MDLIILCYAGKYWLVQLLLMKPAKPQTMLICTTLNAYNMLVVLILPKFSEPSLYRIYRANLYKNTCKHH